MLLPSIFGENLFDDFFDDVPFFDNRAENQIEKKLYGRHAHNVMKTDIKETDDGYELIVDLPGFKKDEIKVSLEDGYLTIEAAKGLDEDEQEKKSGKYIRKERYAGSCQRSFYVGDNLTQEDIKGEFKHGILTLNVPKKEAKPAVETNKYIAIEVDEAIAKLDKYLDDAYLAHLPSVRVVHGKGTGALRNAVQSHLKRLKYVKEYRLGEYGEGDAGVTIVTFK